jgi:hypothetical protein
MKKILLRGNRGFGKFAVVDDNDFEFLNMWKWKVDRDGYAIRTTSRRFGKRYTVAMHRAILQVEDGLEIDHEDRNKLNNQRFNLRPATTSQNQMNVGLNAKNTSGYRGVRERENGYFEADIRINGKKKYIGRYKDPVLAAKAYDEFARKYHGEFAYLNFH